MKNLKGDRSTVRNVLNMKESFALKTIIETKYAESGLDNVAFAAWINTTEEHRSKFRAPLTNSHVLNILVALGIPPNRPYRRIDTTGECLGLVARIQALEDQLSKLTATLIKAGFGKGT